MRNAPASHQVWARGEEGRPTNEACAYAPTALRLHARVQQEGGVLLADRPSVRCDTPHLPTSTPVGEEGLPLETCLEALSSAGLGWGCIEGETNGRWRKAVSINRSWPRQPRARRGVVNHSRPPSVCGRGAAEMERIRALEAAVIPTFGHTRRITNRSRGLD